MTLHKIQSPLVYGQLKPYVISRYLVPVGLDERARELAIYSQTIPGNTVRSNGLISYMKIVGPCHASVRHGRTQGICRRCAGSTCGNNGSKSPGGGLPDRLEACGVGMVVWMARYRRIRRKCGWKLCRIRCVGAIRNTTGEAVDRKMR